MSEREETRDKSIIVVIVSHCKGETRRDIVRQSTTEELMTAQCQMANDHDKVIHPNGNHPCPKKYFVI